MMSTALRIQYVAACLALAAVTGCARGSGKPRHPVGRQRRNHCRDGFSDVRLVVPVFDGECVVEVVNIEPSTAPLGLTVAVVGTDLSAVVDSSGHFQIEHVPSGNVQLKFKDAAVDATAELLNVAQDDFIEIQVQVNGNSAIIVNENRSSGRCRSAIARTTASFT